MDYRSGKWAKEILDSRNEEGMWGNFHTLAQPVRNKAITTEQAIRRLRILGFTKEDEAVQAVLERMCLCVSGEKKIDDYYEKKHDWPLFEKLMLSAWIRLFEPENEIALNVARQWAYIAERAFRSGRYDREDDIEAFGQQFGRKPKSRFTRFSSRRLCLPRGPILSRRCCHTPPLRIFQAGAGPAACPSPPYCRPSSFSWDWKNESVR